MTSLTHPGIERVATALAAAGHGGAVRLLPDACRTAAEAAAAIGCAVDQIAKSIIFRAASGQAVLVVTSGGNRVVEQKVVDALGQPVGKADAGFVRETTGFAIGGVAPVAHVQPPIVFIDQDLRQFDEIWAAAGHPHAVFPLTFDDLRRLTGGAIIAVC
ncbi:cys-tRNA(pro)/cys-tRNA(cys) deacylase [Aliidongia dinghuensis]|uniref:Cys-tRNA(Pro)/cys-tRNA(Cys) deacylase n=1 Tax=Aliidongia dinghuensis TaxID=1867774 RepID=A0A8J3E3P3_9PROT|nr:YbaK/EbsC family protein [Aliidongia dinghuensis]GGF08195.1 cys-tRNA(pro)/cys-tRNA(cys) deacylase [Aliidongia dinghuensis]